jgi:broad specificity phosphatase PhoE
MKNKIPVIINRNGSHTTIELPAKLCFVRHCQSLMNFLSDEANLLAKPELMYIFLNNHHWDFDILLSPIGLHQAALLGQYWNDSLIGNQKYPTCISSPYKRCVQTTLEITSQYFLNHNFMERGSGALYARNIQQLNNIVEDYDSASQDKWNFGEGYSESFSKLQKRLYDALTTLDNSDTVIVTHSDVITTIKSLFESTPDQTFNEYINSLAQEDYPNNGEIIEYDFEQGTVQKTTIEYDQQNWKYTKGKVMNLTLAKLYAK